MMDRTVALHDYLNAVADRQFQPGQFDCALFAAGWVDEVKGSNLLETFRGEYASIQEGIKHLKKMTGRSLRSMAQAWAEPVGGWMAAQPGDVALIRDTTLAFGIVGSGGKIHVLSETRGLDTVPLSRASEVFRP
jgi:hypothetical protein